MFNMPSICFRPAPRALSQCLHPRDAEVIQHMFPNTYAKYLLQAVPSDAKPTEARPLRVGVVFCGRQVRHIPTHCPLHPCAVEKHACVVIRLVAEASHDG
jgi:hypothetical protein